MNLKVHRSKAYAWERRDVRRRYLDPKTVLPLVSMAGAGLLWYRAYSARRWPSSLWLGVCGASVLVCATAGSRHFLMSRSGQDLAVPDVVTQESLDSFPASDAPSSNATTATPRSLSGAEDGTARL